MRLGLDTPPHHVYSQRIDPLTIVEQQLRRAELFQADSEAQLARAMAQVRTLQARLRELSTEAQRIEMLDQERIPAHE